MPCQVRCNVAHLSLLSPPVGVGLMAQDCPSPCLDEPCVTTVGISSTINITGTVNSPSDCLQSVQCFKNNVSNSTQLYSSTTAGNITFAYTVMEGPVKVFCRSVCNHTCTGGQKYAKSNDIIITGEGESVVLFCQYVVHVRSISYCTKGGVELNRK